MPIVYLSNVREYLQGGSACEPERVEAVG
jgi:hypothetical protein